MSERSSARPASHTAAPQGSYRFAGGVVASLRQVRLWLGEAVTTPSVEWLQSSVLASFGRSSARAGGAVVEEEGAGGIVDYNGDVAFESNSIQKLFTVGCALLELGPRFRYCTQVRATSSWDRDGVLAGDLVLVAAGDPTLTGDDLAGLCGAVAGRGIRRVTGSLLVDDSRYDRQRSVPGWNHYYVPDFTGPLSAFVLDRNRPRRDREYLDDPATANGARMLDALRAAGVHVEGGARVASAPTRGAVVAEHLSAPLADLVRRVLTSSDSFSTELLVKELGVSRDAPTTAGGLKVIREATTRLGLAPAEGASATDGSGLASSTADTMRRQVTWLRAIERSPVGEEFLRSLPIAAVSGTLARRFHGTAAAGNVLAKTGTRRRNGTVNLAGYGTTTSGRRLWFSFVLTGASSQADALDALDAAVVALVAR